MRCKKPTVAVAVALFALIASPVRLAAQESQDWKQGHMKEHDRYILIDMGTLGGPESGLFGPGSQVVNNRGTFVGEADTSIPHPYPNLKAPFGDPHPFIRHAFKWQDGVRTDLGALPTLPGGTGLSLTTWISDSGLIVGGSENGVIDPLTGFLGINAVFWNKKGQIIDLGTLGGLFGLAVAVNNQGQAVGYADNGIPDPFSMFGLGTQTRAFLWQHGVMQDLGTLGGPDAAALFVNERGQVAGQAFTNSTPNPGTGSPTMEPFLWEDGKMTSLGTLGGASGFPTALNNRGQVVGLSDLQGDQTFHPFLWHGGTLQDLGTLGGNYGNATGINDAGSVVGWATPPGDEVIHAFLWRHGAITDLGTLTNDPCSFSFSHSINSRGQIVGVSNVCDDPEHPFLWENGKPMVDLNSLVVPVSEVTVTSPIFINDRGEIAAQGTLPNGDVRALLLIPCDGNHAETEGCENAGEGTSEVTQSNPAIVTQHRTTASPASEALSHQPSAVLERLRARFFGLRTPGLATGLPKGENPVALRFFLTSSKGLLDPPQPKPDLCIFSATRRKIFRRNGKGPTS